jgi:integrase/recombinase XerD
MRIRAACEAFLRYCESVRKLSQHTVRAYRLDLCRFARFAGARTAVTECDRSTLNAYVEELFATYHLRETSAKRHIASLRSMFRWLEAEGVIPEDPFHRVRIRIRLPKRLPRVLPRHDIAALLRPTSGSDFRSLTARAAAELLFATGVRVAELAAVRDEDIDLRSGVVAITGKGDRQRRVYIPEGEIRDVLATYRTARDERTRETDAFLVNSRGGAASPQYVRRLIRDLAERASIVKRVTPHMFRHSLATYLLEEGVDIRYVQRLLGHRSIATTEIYTHVADAALKLHVTSKHPRKSIVRLV